MNNKDKIIEYFKEYIKFQICPICDEYLSLEIYDKSRYNYVCSKNHKHYSENIPTQIITSNGKQFTYDQFQSYLKRYLQLKMVW